MTKARWSFGMGASRSAVTRRKKKMTVTTAAALWCLSAMTMFAVTFYMARSRRGACVHRNRQRWEGFIRPLIQDGTFKTRFRMNHSEFKGLYKILQTRLECNPALGRGHNGTVAGEWALASTLQWLAGHGVSAAADGPRMAQSTAYAKIYRGLDAINNCGRLRIKWPRTESELQEKAVGFHERTSQIDPVLKHCVGALDGVLVRIKKPSAKEHPCPDRFFSGHKMTVGLNCQVICDAKYVIIAACCNTPGSTNDRQAYREAKFDSLVESIPGKYYILGDAAYGATNKMIVPYPGCNLDADQDALNFFQSQGRMCIEQTFGIVMKQWPLLHRPLQVPLRNTAGVVHAITRLHNYLRGCRNEPPSSSARFFNEDGTISSNRWATPSSGRPPAATSQTREDIRQDIRERTLVRPAENVARNRGWRTAITRAE
ncbi:unnamed protein product [Pylaiella littoralis]